MVDRLHEARVLGATRADDWETDYGRNHPNDPGQTAQQVGGRMPGETGSD